MKNMGTIEKILGIESERDMPKISCFCVKDNIYKGVAIF